MRHPQGGSTRPDPLFPAEAFLPLCEAGGGQHAVPHSPGALRPFAASLGVVALVEAKKHDTTASRWAETEETERSKDGEVIPDSVTHVYTDT